MWYNGRVKISKSNTEHEAKILKIQNSSFSEDLKEEKIGHWKAEINAFNLNIEKLSGRKNKNKKK